MDAKNGECRKMLYRIEDWASNAAILHLASSKTVLKLLGCKLHHVGNCESLFFSNFYKALVVLHKCKGVVLAGLMCLPMVNAPVVIFSQHTHDHNATQQS